MAPTTTTAKIVIIGGGYAGVALAKILDKDSHIQVTLIERREYFYHPVAAPRSFVDESVQDRILIPYSKLFKNPANKVVQAHVSSISKDQVTLANGETLSFDYLVLATGSRYVSPIKMEEILRENAKNSLRTTSEAIRAAKSILVIGGGPAGVEICAEIASKYQDKKIVLVHSQSSLISGDYPEKFKNQVLDRLKQLNVEVVLGDKVDIPENFNSLEKKTLVTANGVSIESDIQFVCVGAKPNTQLVEDLNPALLDDSKLVKIDSHFRIAGEEYTNIFAIGDITNLPEAKLAFVTGLHADYLGKLLRAAATNSKKIDTIAPYKPNTAKIISIAFSPNGGLTNTPLGILGNFMTRNIKAKDLFISKWNDMLNNA